MGLRPDQEAWIADAAAHYATGARSVLAVAPTGFGKTHAMAELIRRSLAKGHRVVFGAHLSELIEDTHARLTAAGISAGFVQAGRPSDPTAPVQVVSTQTLHRRGERPPADLFILDEAHRVMGATVRAILASYPDAWHFGATATAQRADGQPLGDAYNRLVLGPSVRWLTAQGHLVPSDLFAPKHAGKGLAMHPVAAYQRWAPGRRAIVFASSVAHAEQLVADFVAAGVPVGIFTQKTSREQRRLLRNALSSGDILALVSVNALVEGFDAPAVSCVILARAFTVTGSFLQAIGRGLRPFPGKTRCVVLDLRGAATLHGLPDEDRRWSLDGTAVVRTETIPALQRCGECLAVFRPASSCPRCGVKATPAGRIPRVLTRGERLQNLSHLPQKERDRMYLGGLYQRVKRIPKLARMPVFAQKAWVLKAFFTRFGRAPVCP